MTVLVDANALLFALLAPERLSPRASRILGDRSVTLVWSVASTWEIGIKARLGKDELGGDVAAVLARELTALGFGSSRSSRRTRWPSRRRPPWRGRTPTA